MSWNWTLKMVKVTYILPQLKITSFLVSTGGHAKQTKQESQARIQLRESIRHLSHWASVSSLTTTFKFHEKPLSRAKTHGCQRGREQVMDVGTVLNKTCILPHLRLRSIGEDRGRKYARARQKSKLWNAIP